MHVLYSIESKYCEHCSVRTDSLMSITIDCKHLQTTDIHQYAKHVQITFTCTGRDFPMMPSSMPSITLS